MCYFFIPPQFSWHIANSANLGSAFLFIVMGCLFSTSHERLRRSERDLSSALAEARTANQRINELYRKTVELERAKATFFTNISHELRTPLTLILAPLDMLRTTPGLPPQARRQLDIIERNARFLFRHVNDLLDITKINADQMRLRYARLDLALLVRVVASHFESLAERRAIQYLVEGPESLTIEADGEKLERVLLNLLSNAFKFTPNGGRIAVVYGIEEAGASLRVTDNGPGIPPDSRDIVFERFRQLDDGMERRHDGTGLGLAIVKEFVDLHHGTVVCGETDGGGATFTVTLPIAAPADTIVVREAAAPVESSPPAEIEALTVSADADTFRPIDAASDKSSPLILVVEDNRDLNAYITDALAPLFRIARAFNGEEGLHKALEIRPDIILTDLMMPGMSGDRMVESLRNHPATAKVPIAVLTARSEEKEQLRLLRGLVQDYIVKPFSIEELRVRLSNLVQTGQDAERTRGELAAIVEYSDDAIIGKTLDGIVTSWNRGASRLFGYTSGEVVGTPIVRLFPEDRIGEEQDILARIGHGENVEHFETVRRHKDGHDIDVSITISPIKDRRGTVIGASKIARDISARKAAEREIRQLNADLERRVEERTRELRIANRELDAFAYAVSHDLRAPLRAMSGFARALVEDYGSRLDGEAKTFLDEIDAASKRMGELIEGILTLSRITRDEPRRDRIDLSALAEMIREELIRSAPDRDVTWTIQPGLVAEGDPRMIEAVVANLLGNAWKYTGQKTRAHIRFFAEETGGIRRFCIADDGAGFDMAHVERMFKPFQRLHRQDEFPGLGIGLATVQRIIHRHGGTIEAFGTKDQGATFIFTLPEGRPATP